MSRRRLSPQLLEVVRGWFHLVPHTKEQLRPAAHLAARARAVVMEGGTHTLRWTLGCIDMIVAQCYCYGLIHFVEAIWPTNNPQQIKLWWCSFTNHIMWMDQNIHL